MAGILIFGLGYTASRLAERLRATGWTVLGTRREAAADAIAFDDAEAVRVALAGATHVLSSVPPGEDDPVLERYGTLLTDRHWLSYLSSTGVYGDTQGAWVDESAPTRGRRSARTAADAQWLARGARVFRLPGIYGPGRSALERVAAGRAHRIDLPDQVFSRIHVDDLADAVAASFEDGPPGVYNIADDLPAPQNDVVSCAAAMLGIAPPPIQTMDEAGLSEMARAFYGENRRIANGKAKRLLGWVPRHPDFRAGLRGC